MRRIVTVLQLRQPRKRCLVVHTFVETSVSDCKREPREKRIPRNGEEEMGIVA